MEAAEAMKPPMKAVYSFCSGFARAIYGFELST
jgi:hypothetical protein